MGVVIFDHLRRKSPALREEVISEGGEVKGSRSGLGVILERYGISRKYLKEATTRQVHQDGQRLFELFKWGEDLARLSANERDNLLLELINELVKIAHEQMSRKSLELHLDRRHAPSYWVHLILEGAKGRSGGVVEQHLIGAKLERRYQDISVPNYPAHAGDVQTARQGDFTILNTVYHITAAPSLGVIQKCAENVRVGHYPILLVPRAQEAKAIALAEVEGVEAQISIVSIEDFVALNIIEMGTGEKVDFFHILQSIVEIYNRRLLEVETDLSLQIEIR